MAEDSAAPVSDGQEPVTAPPDQQNDGTVANTPSSKQPVDWEKRYEALRTDHARKATENAALKRQVEAFEAQSDEELDESDEDDEAEPAPRQQRQSRSAATDEALERAERAEWALAETIHGSDIIEAYTAAVDLFNQAATAADAITAFEAYHQRRIGGAPPAAAAQPGTGNLPSPDALAPRVDTNRQDAAPDLDLDPQAFAGGANGGARGFFAKQVEKLGLG